LLTVVLCGVILQYVWRVQEVFSALAAVRFTAVVSVGAIVLFLLNAQRARRVAHLRHPLFRLILAIFILAVLSIPFSVHDGASFRFVTDNFVKTVVLVGVLAASIRDRRDVERLLRILVVGGAAYVIASAVLAPPTAVRLGGKGSYDPNDLGLFTVSTLPFCLYLMRRRARWSDRMLGFGAAATLLVGTVRTGSRGGFLALVAVALYGVLLLDAVRLSKRVTVAVVAGAVLLGAAGDVYRERISTILNPQKDYNWSGQAESGRIEVWKRGLGYMATHPLVGVGVDAFPVAEGLSQEAAADRIRRIGFKWSAAHSAYVQIGAELGVFGLAAFVMLLVLAFREARGIGRTAASGDDRLLGQAFGALVVGFAVGGAFLSQAYATYLYFSVGLLIGLSRVVIRDPVPQAAVALRAGNGPAPAGARRYRAALAGRGMPR
jgi:O-antigen ligase